MTPRTIDYELRGTSQPQKDALCREIIRYLVRSAAVKREVGLREQCCRARNLSLVRENGD